MHADRPARQASHTPTQHTNPAHPRDVPHSRNHNTVTSITAHGRRPYTTHHIPQSSAHPTPRTHNDTPCHTPAFITHRRAVRLPSVDGMLPDNWLLDKYNPLQDTRTAILQHNRTKGAAATPSQSPATPLSLSATERRCAAAHTRLQNHNHNTAAQRPLLVQYARPRRPLRIVSMLAARASHNSREFPTVAVLAHPNHTPSRQRRAHKPSECTRTRAYIHTARQAHPTQRHASINSWVAHNIARQQASHVTSSAPTQRKRAIHAHRNLRAHSTHHTAPIHARPTPCPQKTTESHTRLLTAELENYPVTAECCQRIGCCSRSRTCTTNKRHRVTRSRHGMAPDAAVAPRHTHGLRATLTLVESGCSVSTGCCRKVGCRSISSTCRTHERPSRHTMAPDATTDPRQLPATHRSASNNINQVKSNESQSAHCMLSLTHNTVCE